MSKCSHTADVIDFTPCDDKWWRERQERAKQFHQATRERAKKLNPSGKRDMFFCGGVEAMTILKNMLSGKHKDIETEALIKRKNS